MTKQDENENANIDPNLLDGDSPFRNSLLIALPSMDDGNFTRSVIYICAHSAAGAMGIVVNQRLPDVAFGDLLSQLHLPKSEMIVEPVVHFGGPVESGRGFVLHSAEFMRDDTLRINDQVCMTGTVDILRDMAAGKGPAKSLFALGYAGWGAGQLEAEIQANAWLVVPVDQDILFSQDLNGKWEKALSLLGVNPLSLSAHAGQC